MRRYSRPSTPRSLRSAGETFRYFSLSFRRSINLRFCSSLEICRKNLRIKGPILVQVPFERIDVGVASSPGIATFPRWQTLAFQYLRVYSDDEDVLMVGTVEDPYLPFAGRALEWRHRKSWSSSSEDGTLKLVTRHPWGLTPDMT